MEWDSPQAAHERCSELEKIKRERDEAKDKLELMKRERDQTMRKHDELRDHVAEFEKVKAQCAAWRARLEEVESERDMHLRNWLHCKKAQNKLGEQLTELEKTKCEAEI